MILLVPIAFLAGVITVFTPCVLPVLPIVLAGGTTATKRKPYAIVAGLVTAFTAFTLLVPRVGVWLERPLLFLTRRQAGDLGGGFVLGAALGLVFVPCSGPVL